MSFPLEHEWNVYIHFRGEYCNSYETVDSFRCIHSFWNLFNSLYSDEETKPINTLCPYSNKIVTKGSRLVSTWSFFKNHTSPEWEDAFNRSGFTLTYHSYGRLTDANIILDILLYLIGEQCSEHVNGCQFTKKRCKTTFTSYLRCDIWYRQTIDIENERARLKKDMNVMAEFASRD